MFIITLYLPPFISLCRASYDPVKKKLDPPIDHWGKHCLCQLPLNPDLQYIECDKCNVWYHMDCVGIDPKEAESIETFICPKCKK